MIKRWLAIVMALLIMVGSLPQMAVAASPLDSWTVRGPLPTGENLIDVAYGNGTYVAVGNNGVVMTSVDGASWTNQTSGITSNLKDVSYINDQFVAVGQGGKIILSDDGASWTSATNNDTSELTSVAYGNGMYVAVGGFGKVLTSGDGASWTLNPNSPVIGNSVLYAITFGNGVFVIAGNNGSDGTIYTSSDGTSWTSQSSNVYVSLLDAVYGLDKYVVVGTEGKIVTSEDGVTWTQRTSGTQENLLSVTYGNGKYVATANSGVIKSSTDGVTWSNETSGVNSGSLMGVAYGPGTYVVVGTGGTILTGTDGGAWTIRSPLPTSSGLNGIAYGNGTYVAVGSGGTVATSGDGITWSNRTKSSMTQYLSGVAFGKGVFVAADANGTMHASADGITWSNNWGGVSTQFNGVAYGNGLFIAVGANGWISTSEDGTSWTGWRSNTTQALSGVSYGKGKYVAVGDAGTVVVSSDGMNWTSQTSGTTKQLKGIAYGNSTFVAAGADGTLIVSTDGVNWTSAVSNSTVSLNGIVYRNHTFVAVGAAGVILTSNDGTSWIQSTNPDALKYNAVAYSNGEYVAVGESGRVLQSGTSTILPEVSGVDISPRSVSLVQGGSQQLTASVEAAGGAATTVTWTSSDTSGGVTVDAAGNVTVAATATLGYHTITATSTEDGGQLGTSTITVTAAPGAPAVSSVSIAPSYSSVQQGKSQQLTATVSVEHGAATTVHWSSSDISGKVAVDATGKVTVAPTAVPGSYTIRATSTVDNSKIGTATITVTVVPVTWTSRGSSSVTSSQLNGLTYGSGKYVAVGNSGTVVTSEDGVTWTRRTVSGVTQNLQSVIHENGKYVAVGQNSTIITSDDGLTWTKRTVSGSQNLQSVTYGNGKFVAVGANGRVITSPDGTSWTVQTSNVTYNLNGVTYGNGQYVAVGYVGTVITSANAITWTAQTINSYSDIYSIAYENGKYIAGGSYGALISSPDGVSWASHISNASYHLNGIAYGNDMYVVVGNSGKVVTSADGVNWTLQSSSSSTTNNLLKVIYVNDTFMAVGANGTILQSVPDPAVNSVSVSPSSVSVERGRSQQLTATVDVVGNAATTVTWTSSDTDGLVTVDAAGNVAVAANAELGPYTIQATSTADATKIGTATITVIVRTQTDEEAVADDKAALELGFGNGDSETNVTQDLTLPTSGASGTAINWSSDEVSVIADNGQVTRPSAAAGDQLVTLTATITKGSVNDTRTFTVTVKAAPKTDAEAVADDKASLEVGFGTGDNDSNVTQDLTLPASGANGTTITWSSNTPNVIADNGQVTRPSAVAGDQFVTLTATITKGSVTDTQTFDVTVKAASQTDAEAVADDKASLEVGFGNGDSDTNVTQDLTLPATGANGTTITWSSNVPSVIADNGQVTRPSATTGDQFVTLTATITKGSVTDTQTFDVTVKAAPQTDAEAVADDKGALAISFGGSDIATNVTHDLTLPASGANGTTITWSSNTPNVIADNGQVTRPSATVGDQLVILTATITKGSATDTQTFDVTVKAAPQTDAEAVADDKAALAISFGGNDIATNVTHDLTLPASGANGTTITWSSNTPNVIADNGQVTRPSAAAGDQQVTLTATITKGSATDTRTFIITVKALPAPPSVYYPAPTTTTNTGQANEAAVIVLVNGKAEQAGVTTVGKRNEQTILTIAVDEKKLGDKLAAEGQGAIMTIPVNTQSDVVIGELNGQMVKNMENQKAVVEIKTDRATYKLPAQQLNIDAISEQIGKTVALEDIKIQVEIAAPTSDTLKVVENAAAKGTFTLVVPPIEFTIRAIYESMTVEVSQFKAYVERTIAIPAGVDPDKITTGIVVEPDGTTRHVPTKIVKVDGQYYAQISSVTNSTYAIVWHPLEFLDVVNHWSQKAVNDMGARMVIEGTGDGLFSPDRDITRAEFATILVQALGLKLEEGATAFVDVNTSDWYSRAINTAYTYQLVQGYEDGTFRPQDKITREQAMTMLSRAMAMTGLKAQLSESWGDTLLHAFEDASDVSDWAGRSVADSVQAGLVTGRSAAELAPKAFITRAEVATIMQRLLQKSDLI
ncbi:immunoglobulin-like domain-containing protein [Paenibacillus sp. 598K]|uniref:immunoglobulin-like domain-containing protein n=1 Tax=Paenibacillus sp. 598K TaxID=1117987 RepID=UPI001C86FE18|nr:immunoglobulin-like domain-containing protein [Paenibacillus sp. 598K]